MCETFKALEDLENVVLSETDDEYEDKSCYRNYSKDIALTVGYLMGVNEEYLKIIADDEELYNSFSDRINKNNSARAIRALNNIRTNIILNFKSVSERLRDLTAEYKPIYKLDVFKDDFDTLQELEVKIITGRSDLNEYLKIINTEIVRKLDNVEVLFPDWVNFKYIRNMFTMPKNIEVESKKFQHSQSFYPFKRYFNWNTPYEMGNILQTDAKLLDIIYRDNGTYFDELNRVMDVSDNVKNNINDFIQRGKKIQIFIDGENVNPYNFASALDGLSDEEIDKIDKIVVYYDVIYSSRAWKMLKHFASDVDVEIVAVERIKEDKSLVDHKLVAGVSKAVYKEDVDSVILVSSDSDFWSVIQDVDANYLVMLESDKCGYEFKALLREHDIFYCFIEKFIAPEDDLFFKTVFRKELETCINARYVKMNAWEILNDVIRNTRVEISEQEQQNLFKKYIETLKLDIDEDGNLFIKVAE